METRALCIPTDTLKAAISQWHTLDHDPGAQLALAREAAQCRQPELTLAYRNVVSVGAGYRKKRTRSGKQKLVPEPCVIFVVRRKWGASDVPRDDRQTLPRHLLSYAVVNGARTLCAIPTDVQLEAVLFTVRPRADSLGWTDDPSHPESGTLGCLVEVSGNAGTERFALSAMHVFSPRPQVGPPSLSEQRAFRPMDGAGKTQASPVIATTTDFGGVLRDHTSGLPTFDVQLARIAKNQGLWVHSALADQRLAQGKPFVHSETEFEQLATTSLFDLAVPNNHAERPSAPRPRMLCEFSGWKDETMAIPYRARRGNQLVVCEAFHRQLIEFNVLGAHRPLAGDSGCAVLLYLGDGTCRLVGLFIASADSEPLAYAIPAWHLFDATRYWNLPSGATLRPVNP